MSSNSDIQIQINQQQKRHISKLINLKNIF